MTGPEPSFAVEVDQNVHLPAGATEVDAVVTVTATGGPAAAPGDALEVLVVDTSGSMHGEKIRSARQATSAALAELRDGVSFAVISGVGMAVQVYPRDGGTGVADGAITAAAMGKNTADVALRLWTPRGARVRFVKQVAPTVADLTGRRTESGPQRGDYPLGSWGAESRDYHVGSRHWQASERVVSRAARSISSDRSLGGVRLMNIVQIEATWPGVGSGIAAAAQYTPGRTSWWSTATAACWERVSRTRFHSGRENPAGGSRSGWAASSTWPTAVRTVNSSSECIRGDGLPIRPAVVTTRIEVPSSTQTATALPVIRASVRDERSDARRSAGCGCQERPSRASAPPT
jgi:hypothetical protein